MTSPHDETGRDPQDRPDLTQEIWPDATAEHRVSEAAGTRGTAEHRVAETGATQQLPTGDTEEQPATAAAARTTEPEAATQALPWPPAAPAAPRPTGPHLPAVLLGLVCLAVAGVVLAQELGNLTIDWGDVGPLGFVAVGAVLVVLGIIGLAGSNRRNARS
jgi:hypothetical protein